MNEISLVEGGIHNTIPTKEITIKEALDLVGSDKYKALVEKIRECTDKAEKSKLKIKLDYFMFGGTFDKRNNKSLKKSSQLVVLDLDDTTDEVREKLMKDKFVYFIFTSPSGNGLKVGVKIPSVKDDTEYKQHWNGVSEYFDIEENDEKTKDISRACFVSYDNNVYYNPESEVLDKVGSKVMQTKEVYVKGIGMVESEAEDDFIKNVKEKWVSGDRQELSMSVAGYLRKNKRLGLDSALSIVERIARDCQDEEVNQRLAAVRATYDKDESEIKGISGLKELGVKENNLPMVRISGSGLLVSEVSKTIADVYSQNQILFYKQELREIVEVSKIKHDAEDKSFLGFSVIRPNRFITLSEKYFTPYVYSLKKDELGNAETIMVAKSLTKDKANIILASPHFQDSMPVIKRIFSVPIPMMYNGELTFPKSGYDNRFYSWLNPNAPNINTDNMTVEEAKNILKSIFNEFCFESKQDYTNAIAGLLTPFLRGIFPDFTTRTPMFFYVANRERAGKDYLASITGLALEGQALDEPPISDGENNGNKNDELRKKILSSLLQGRRRLHFANNKGRINNSVLEATLTSKRISDRLLGKNEVISVDNELDISASGNVGITFTPDLGNRCIFVKLFLDIENANDREFSNPNLHGWVMENREKVLSAIFCLIEDWVKKGEKKGSRMFASFPEWAAICGGIMENAELGSPCIPNDEALTIGGDNESQEMKQLFELLYLKYPEKEISKVELMQVIKEDGNLFSYIDWDKRGDQTKIGTKIIKHYGRIFSDIKLKVLNQQVKQSRQHRLIFTKKIKEVGGYDIFNDGNVSNLGNLNTTHSSKKDKIEDNEEYENKKSFQLGVEVANVAIIADSTLRLDKSMATSKNEEPKTPTAYDLKKSKVITICPKCTTPMMNNKCLGDCE